MLISQRRLKWSAVMLLTLCCILLFRPLRSSLDQLLLRRVLHPSLHVGELVFHNEHSIVEARHLRLVGQQGKRRVGMAATRGWFAIDQAALVDAQIEMPKVVLQDVRMFMNTVPSSASYEQLGWKNYVANRIAALDWQKIKSNLDSLLASQDLADTWQRRIDRWLQRSDQILKQANEVEQQAQSLDNPLRSEDVLRMKLAQVEEMAKEQEILIDQYDGVKKLLDAERKRLQELHKVDLQRIADVARGNTPVEGQPDRLELGRELATGIAHSVWKRFASYAEVTDSVAMLARAKRPEAHDVNVRRQHGRRLLDVQEIKAQGVYEYGVLRTPFEATGKCALLDAADFSRQCVLDWEVAYQEEQEQISVQILHDSQLSNANRLLMNIHSHLVGPVARVDAEASPSDRVGDLNNLVADAVPGRQLVHCELTSQADGELQGALVVHAAGFKIVDDPALVRLAQKLETAGSSRQIEFVIRGSWGEPHLMLCEPPPAWLLAAVEDEIQAELAAVRSDAEQRLEIEFRTSQEQLQRIIDTVVERSRQLAQDQRQQLLATQARLQKQLDAMTGAEEFARRPPASLNR